MINYFSLQEANDISNLLPSVSAAEDVRKTALSVSEVLLRILLNFDVANYLSPSLAVISHRLLSESLVQKGIRRLLFSKSILNRFLNTALPQILTGNSGLETMKSILMEAATEPVSAAIRTKHLETYQKKVGWAAAMLPSGDSKETDTLFLERAFLEKLKERLDSAQQGVLLPLRLPPKDQINLRGVSAPFSLAVARRALWPGILLWTPEDRSIFLQLSRKAGVAAKQIDYLFSHQSVLFRRGHFNRDTLLKLEKEFIKFSGNLDPSVPSIQDIIVIVHISDTHLGKKSSNARVTRLTTILETIVKKEYPEKMPITPVVTGDILDSSNQENIETYMMFDNLLQKIFLIKPVYILGNHDVRKKGVIFSNYQPANYIKTKMLVTSDIFKLHFLCFDSNEKGKLARGKVSDLQYGTMGNELDLHGKMDYLRIALLHHHPYNIPKTKWCEPDDTKGEKSRLVKALKGVDRLFGRLKGKTTQMIDAQPFLQWIYQQNVDLVLHGHEHRPYLNDYRKIPIVACGSSVGEGTDEISVNVIHIDRQRKRAYCSYRLETKIGSGLKQLCSRVLPLS